MRVYRSILGDLGKNTGNGDNFILNAHALPSTSQLLAAERLSLFCRILCKGTEQLLLAVAGGYSANSSNDSGNRSWLRSVELDLMPLVARFECLSDMRDLSFSEMCGRISNNPLKYKRLFRRCLIIECTDPYFDLDGDSNSKKHKHKNIDPYSDAIDALTCEVCFSRFRDRRALASHKSRVHGIRSEAMRWCRSRVCWGCAVDFGSVSRVLQHLNRRQPNTCLNAIKALDFPLSDVEQQSLREEQGRETSALNKEGKRAHFALKAAVRVCGPALR